MTKNVLLFYQGYRTCVYVDCNKRLGHVKRLCSANDPYYFGNPRCAGVNNDCNHSITDSVHAAQTLFTRGVASIRSIVNHRVGCMDVDKGTVDKLVNDVIKQEIRQGFRTKSGEYIPQESIFVKLHEL